MSPRHGRRRGPSADRQRPGVPPCAGRSLNLSGHQTCLQPHPPWSVAVPRPPADRDRTAAQGRAADAASAARRDLPRLRDDHPRARTHLRCLRAQDGFHGREPPAPPPLAGLRPDDGRDLRCGVAPRALTHPRTGQGRWSCPGRFGREIRVPTLEPRSLPCDIPPAGRAPLAPILRDLRDVGPHRVMLDVMPGSCPAPRAIGPSDNEGAQWNS